MKAPCYVDVDKFRVHLEVADPVTDETDREATTELAQKVAAVMVENGIEGVEASTILVTYTRKRWPGLGGRVKKEMQRAFLSNLRAMVKSVVVEAGFSYRRS